MGKFLGARNRFYEDVRWLYPRFKKFAPEVTSKKFKMAKVSYHFEIAFSRFFVIENIGTDTYYDIFETNFFWFLTQQISH